MDPRNTPTHQPFARPLSPPGVRDAQHAPIPPPPYILQAPLRTSQPTLNHDPFLPRRNEQEDARHGQHKPLSQSPFSLSHYAAGLQREASGVAIENRDRVQENGASWIFGDGRTDRYRSQSGDGSSSSSLPPPPSSAFGTSLQDPASQRDAARQQEHRTSSPRMYGATQEIPPPPPPPPPPMNGRPMLPPSPSPHYNARATMSQVPPPPPPFSGRRELPALSSTARPGSSMSISSMLDSGPSRTPREPAAAAQINGTSPTGSYSSSAHQLSASSPTKTSHGNGFLHRSSPDKFRTSQPPTNRPFRAYSGGAPNRPYTNVKAISPDGPQFGPLSATSLSQYSPRSETSAQLERRQQHDRHSSIGGIIDRPISQPNGYRESPLELKRRTEMESLRADTTRLGEAVGRDMSVRPARVSSFEYLSREAQLERQPRLEQQAQLERQAELERQQRPEQDKLSAAQGSPRDDRLRGMDYPFLTQSSVFSEPPSSGPRPDKESVASRIFDRDLHSQYNPTKGPMSEESLRRLREERQRQNQNVPNYSPSASRHRFLDNGNERQVQSNPHNSFSGRDGNGSTYGGIQMSRTAEDGSQSHRTMLATMFENKRPGRISPLPQAVQGAQGQTRGPSTDPSIKNEFSRMFAGIGSGVGSNSGASTPFPPPSPKQNHDSDQRLPFSSRKDLFELGKSSRNGSRAGKRSRKVKNDEDVEIVESRAINPQTSSRRGEKKSRHGHHHHHRHHHRLDDQNGSSSHHHHLHHHHNPDGTISYHNHTKTPVTKPPPRMPTTIINNDRILESVQTLPRQHLGSIVYSPTVESPTSQASMDSKLSYTTAPYTIPRCEGKENCTLTVRIPKFYLSKEEREQVCLRRAVWGTDIYTDDSDPLTAAIHSGWVRGDWGDLVDISMMELNPTVGLKESEQQSTLSAPPASPMLPPPGMDLHLTLLILPTLQNYTPRVMHGIKSRAWGRDHDGMSYRIEKIVWVDEKSARGEERDGEARRKRLKMITGSRTTGPVVHFGIGQNLSGGKVGIVAA